MAAEIFTFLLVLASKSWQRKRHVADFVLFRLLHAFAQAVESVVIAQGNKMYVHCRILRDEEDELACCCIPEHARSRIGRALSGNNIGCGALYRAVRMA